MRFIDYSNWIWNEVKGSKTFTILNIIGVWINVCVLVLFFSLALGIEETAVKQITRNIDLFTIEVSTSRQPLFSFSDFSRYEADSRVLQITPVLSEFITLKIVQNDTALSSEEDNAGEKIYMESYFLDDMGTGEDLRTTYLKMIDGQKLTRQTPNGILISEPMFKRLASKSNVLNYKNYREYSFELVVKRSGDKFISFPCNIVGIAEKTLFNGALAYAAFPLAEKISDWKNSITTSPLSVKERKFDRFDLVTKDLKALEDVRREVKGQGYETRSVLDRIDNVRQILFFIKLLFLFIVGISVLISAFNIVITLTSYVFKRQKEIGILKSLGATDFQVQSIFVLHSIYLTLTGGILGAFTGWLITQLITTILSRLENFQNINLFKIDLNCILWIVLCSVMVGVISAFAPAQKAASITPIETIRGS